MSDSISDLEAVPLLGPARDGLRARLDPLLGSFDAVSSGRALLVKAELAMASGALAEASTDVVRAGKQLEGQPPWEMLAGLLAARILNRTMNRQEAASLLEEIRPKLDLANPTILVALRMTEGELALDRGDHGTARRAFETVLPLAGDDTDAHEKLQALFCLGFLAQSRQDIAGAVAWLGQARALAAAHGDNRKEAEAAFSEANHRISLGEVEAGLALLDRVAEGDLPPLLRPMALFVLAQHDLKKGDAPTALRRALAGARAGAAVANAGWFANGTILAAEAQRRMGQVPAALKTLEAGESVLRGRGEQKMADLLVQTREDMTTD